MRISPEQAAAALAEAAAPEPENEDFMAPVKAGTMDPLNPRRVSHDIFELYCYEMIMTEDVERRVYLTKKLRYMVESLISKHYDYGRLYNFMMMANLVARVCGRQAYHSEEDNDEKYVFKDRLIDFVPEVWKKVAKQLVKLRKSLIRNDATLIVLPEENYNVAGADEVDEATLPEWDNEINTEIESTEAFLGSFLEMKDRIKFHTCLSHIQPQFEDALQQEDEVIPYENIVALDRAIAELFAGEEDNYFAKILKSLFSDGRSTYATQAEGLSLKPLNLKPLREIKRIYTNHIHVFDLENFQSEFIKLIRQWTKMVLPVPSLAKFGYGNDMVQNDRKRKMEEN